MDDIVFETIPRDDIHIVKPLWDRLRLLTRDMTVHFKEMYEGLTFEDRIRKFFEEGTRARIDIARDRGTGQVVGYSIGSVDAGGVGELDSFYVDEAYRGRGIGGKLLERTIGWMEGQGPKEWVIFTAVENHQVLRLYERFGFHPRHIKLGRK